MKLFPLHKNTLALILVVIMTIGFFVAGLLEVLNYFIIKILLFASFGLLVVSAVFYGFKNEDKKNRPEDIPQDDSH